MISPGLWSNMWHNLLLEYWVVYPFEQTKFTISLMINELEMQEQHISIYEFWL